MKGSGNSQQPPDLTALRPFVLSIFARRGVPKRDREDQAQEVLFALWRYSQDGAIVPVENKTDTATVRTLLAGFVWRQASDYRDWARYREGGLGVDPSQRSTRDLFGQVAARESLQRVADLPPRLREVLAMVALGHGPTEPRRCSGSPSAPI
jgi:DNA-directed RNA polymerase specialized sigma24 family protein